jgi:hypothetical protein
MGWYRTSGGAVLEMDVPPEGSQRREHFDGKLAAGELVELFDVERVALPDGGYIWLDTAVPAVFDPEGDVAPPVEGETENVGERPKGRRRP